MKAIADRFNKMNANAKGIVLVLGAYTVTMGLVIFIIAFSTLFFIDTTSCSAVTRSLAVLGVTMAVAFFTSVVVVGKIAWKIYSNFAGRLALVAVHGAATLASLIVVAFVLLVIFNC